MEFNATFIASAISFIVFVFVMNAIFYKPLNNVVQQRQKFIDDTNEEAKQHKEKSEALIKDREHKIEKTKHEARKIISDKSDAMKAEKSTMTSEAQKKAADKVETAKSELQKSGEEAEKSLADETKKLADEISAKILGKI